MSEKGIEELNRILEELKSMSPEEYQELYNKIPETDNIPHIIVEIK